MKEVNISTKKQNLYLPILNTLKETTNLTKIRQKLSISKQNLNNYLIKLKQGGYIIQKGRGYYEINRSKVLTNHDKLLLPDFTRGHAYVWTIKLPQEIEQGMDWKDRVKVLKNKGIHFNLVGALKTTPRIKVLGRKVWLCNNNIRIYDKPNSSYYGLNAKESRYSALNEVLFILDALNTKLGVSMSNLDIEFKKEHYALIKNALAIEHNKKGETLHIKDKFGEWLLIDDSFGQGGELETIGKSAYRTNIPLQKWWNNHKETGFKVTPTFILEGFNKLLQNQQTNTNDIHYIAQNYASHVGIVERLNKLLEEPKVKRHLRKKTNQNQTKLGDFL